MFHHISLYLGQYLVIPDSMLTYKGRIILCVITPLLVYLSFTTKSLQLNIGVSWRVEDLLRGFDQTLNQAQENENLSTEEMENIKSEMENRTAHLNRICSLHSELLNISDHYLFRLR